MQKQLHIWRKKYIFIFESECGGKQKLESLNSKANSSMLTENEVKEDVK